MSSIGNIQMLFVLLKFKNRFKFRNAFIKNLSTVQILLGYTKLESTVRYLGVEVEGTLELPETIYI
jgi:hypothetical protein